LSLLLWSSPTIIRNLLEDNSEAWLGRRVSLTELKINYFTATVQAIDFKMYEADRTTPFVSFDTLLLDTEPYQYFTSKIVVEQLYLKSLKTTLVKENDSLFNFDSLVSFYASPKGTIQEQEISEELKFSVSNIEFVNADLNFTDRVVNEDFDIDNINFFIPNIEWNQEEKSNADLRFRFTDGGSFTSSTAFDPVMGDFSAQIKIDSLAINSVEKYLKNTVEFKDLNGFLSTELAFEGSTRNFEDLSVKGTVDVSQFSLTSKDDKPIFSFTNLHCPIQKMTPLKQQFEIGTVILDSPFVDFVRYEKTTNIERIVKEAPADEPTNQKEVDSLENDVMYSVESFKINKGKMALKDARTSSPFYYELSNLSVQTSAINNGTTWLETHSEMEMNKTGNLVIDFNFNPKKADQELEMVYDVSGLKLKDLNPYSLDYLGIPIYKGELHYKANTTVSNNYLKSENKVIIHNISLGDKNGGEYNVPVKFAVFLLKDNRGIVRMDVPVEGDMEESDVEIKGVIWDAFRNLIIKTAASPGKLLAGMVGANKEELEVIQYNYLDTTITSEREKQVKILQSLKKKKKGLKVSLKYVNNKDQERVRIAVNELEKKYMKKKNIPVITERDDFVAYVNKKAKTVDLSVEDASVLAIKQEKLTAFLEQYENGRIGRLEKYLNELDAENDIEINRPKDAKKDSTSITPHFKITYTMTE